MTGATGFLGSHLCRRLRADGHEVRALRRAGSDGSELERLGVESVVGDVTDSGAVTRLVAGCDAVFHAASAIAYGSSHAAEHERVNVQGTRAVAAACRSAGSARLVHVSSVAAIGVPADAAALDESAAFNAERFSYHRSKHRAEGVVREEVSGGLDAVIVNPGSILGPSRGGYRGAELPRGVARRAVVPYYVGGTSAVHVDDVLDGVFSALRSGVSGERYILAGENLPWAEMARIAAREIGVRRVFVPLVPPLPGALSLARALAAGRGRPRDLGRDSALLSVRHQYYDSAKARAALGFAPRPYREIVRDYLGWASART